MEKKFFSSFLGVIVTAAGWASHVLITGGNEGVKVGTLLSDMVNWYEGGGATFAAVLHNEATPKQFVTIHHVNADGSLVPAPVLVACNSDHPALVDALKPAHVPDVTPAAKQLVEVVEVPKADVKAVPVELPVTTAPIQDVPAPVKLDSPVPVSVDPVPSDAGSITDQLRIVPIPFAPPVLGAVVNGVETSNE